MNYYATPWKAYVGDQAKCWSASSTVLVGGLMFP